MVDLNKPVQTRCGFPVRIIMTNLRNAFPIVAVVDEYDDIQVIRSYATTGKYMNPAQEHSLDLVNIPEKITRYTNVYEWGGLTEWHDSISECDAISFPDRLGVVSFEFEGNKLISSKIFPIEERDNL